MMVKVAAKNLFSHFMGRLSAREIELRKTISDWEEIRDEMKKAKMKLDMPDFILLQAHRDLDEITERKEQIQSRSMEYFQELSIMKIADGEIDDDFVQRMMAEGHA